MILLCLYIENKIISKVNNINKIHKISVFLPIFNKEKYLKRSIGSIQKQTLKDIEIIAVNDGSTDNSLYILKNLSRKDSRIKIINNKKNKGLLYSRAMGILNSKSEYLMNLDPDDELNYQNSLKFLYNKALKSKVDFITFLILYLPDKIKYSFNSYCNKIIVQPELFENAFEQNNLKDYFITNKLIKKGLLLKVFSIFKNKIFGNMWNYHEDNIWSVLLHKYAKSALHINKVIYYYYKNYESVSMNKGNILELENLLYRQEMYKEIFNNKNEEKYLISGYLELLKIFNNNTNFFILKKNNEIKNKIIIKSYEVINNYNITKAIKKLIFDFIDKLNI